MALFRTVAELAEALAKEPGRLKKRAAIAEAIRRLHEAAPESEDAGRFALYVAGTPFAEADPRKLNAGGALLTKALLTVSGATQVALTAAYRKHGDLGAAGFDLMSSSHAHTARKFEPPLTLTEIADAFAAMAAARTTAVRASLVEGLLERATPLEAKYLLKLMIGDMRIGVKQSLVEEAIAVAAEAPVTEVRHAVMLEADLSAAVQRAFAGTLKDARMRLFHPLGFMLASPVASPEEAVERFTGEPEEEVETAHIKAFLEDKYDGMRAQLHCGDPGQPGRVAIYSRNREDITESYPELEEAFAKVNDTGAGSLIFDGEILGWDLKEGHALPFTVLGQRIGRKRVSNAWREQVPVIFMAFDLMYADGELLLDRPLKERRNRLESVAERLVETVRSPLAVDERTKSPQGLMFAEPEG